MVDFSKLLAMTPAERKADADALVARMAANELRHRAAAATHTICVEIVEAGSYKTMPDGTRVFQFACRDVHKTEANIRAAFELYCSDLLDTEEQNASMEETLQLGEILNLAGHYVTRRWKSGDRWMSQQSFMVDVIDAPRAPAEPLLEKSDKVWF